MKKRLILSVGVLLVAVAVVGSQVLAQSQPRTTPRGSTFEQRLSQRKTERQIRLDERDRTRLEGTCVNAQGKIRGVQQRAAAVLDNRSKTYLSIDAKLWVMIGRLRLAEQNTFPLEKLRAGYATDVGRFQTLAHEYRQVLDDLTLVNCQADVAGFKALLDTARIYHKQLRTQSATLRDQVVNDIKNNLNQHAQDLQPQPSTEGVE